MTGVQTCALPIYRIHFEKFKSVRDYVDTPQTPKEQREPILASGRKLATARRLLEEIVNRTNHTYEELLLEDFMHARGTDKYLTHQYHRLLAGKLMPELAHVEITDAAQDVQDKRQAFARALQNLTAETVDVVREIPAKEVKSLDQQFVEITRDK